MADLTFDDISDVVAGTLKDLGPPQFSQIAQDLQDYEMMGYMLKDDVEEIDSGIGIQRNLMTKYSNAARHTSWFSDDNVNIEDLMTQLSVTWVHADTTWAFIYQETLANRGKALVFNVIKPRRAGAMIGLAEELETKLWASPVGSAEAKTEPLGIPHFVVKNATQGFNGGLPSGFSTVAGVDLTAHPNYKNYTDQYVAVSKQDLIKKMRRMYRKTRFKSPVNVAEYRSDKGMRYRYYVNETTISDFEDLGEAQNENLGRDLASMDGEMTFRRNPIRWVPKLDDDSTNPVYQLDRQSIFPVCLKGDNMRETGPERVPNKRNVRQVAVDLTYNFICINRRCNGVISL